MYERAAFTMYPVKDMARARAFYEDTLGIEVGAIYGEMWTEYDFGGGGCLALFAGDKVEPSPAAASLAIEVADLDALIETLKGKDVTFMETMIESPVCRMSVIQDSEGNGLILHELREKR